MLTKFTAKILSTIILISLLLSLLFFTSCVSDNNLSKAKSFEAASESETSDDYENSGLKARIKRKRL